MTDEKRLSADWKISIHALLAESDDLEPSNTRRLTNISIHALLAESDANLQRNQHQRKHFYPRSPCGERPELAKRGEELKGIFLSTLSLRRATEYDKMQGNPKLFLSTLSLRRATSEGAAVGY